MAKHIHNPENQPLKIIDLKIEFLQLNFYILNVKHGFWGGCDLVVCIMEEQSAFVSGFKQSCVCMCELIITFLVYPYINKDTCLAVSRPIHLIARFKGSLNFIF